MLQHEYINNEMAAVIVCTVLGSKLSWTYSLINVMVIMLLLLIDFIHFSAILFLLYNVGIICNGSGHINKTGQTADSHTLATDPTITNLKNP